MSVSPGVLALAAVVVAEAYKGTVEEGGSNRGEKVEAFLASVDLPPGLPWCAAFVRHCLEAAEKVTGQKIPKGFPDSGWCPSYHAWAQRTASWMSISEAIGAHVSGLGRPQRGDLACFWFPAKGRIAHIGFVAQPSRGDGGLITVEGNTTPGIGVDREGDGVWVKRRRWSDFGSGGGFIRLKW